MAEEFEVRGVHEHVLDHAAEHGGPDSFAGRIAVMTAILSTAGAIFGYQGGATQNEALLLKNEAAIHKTEASNQWAYYQAKSQKQAIAELAGQLPGVDHEAAKREAQRYGTEKEQIRQTAETHERRRRGRQGERGGGAPPPPLGAGPGGHPGLHRAGGYHAADAASVAAGVLLRDRCAGWDAGGDGVAASLNGMASAEADVPSACCQSEPRCHSLSP